MIVCRDLGEYIHRPQNLSLSLDETISKVTKVKSKVVNIRRNVRLLHFAN